MDRTLKLDKQETDHILQGLSSATNELNSSNWIKVTIDC